jgi:Protein of unknown function (DUF760)
MCSKSFFVHYESPESDQNDAATMTAPSSTAAAARHRLRRSIGHFIHRSHSMLTVGCTALIMTALVTNALLVPECKSRLQRAAVTLPSPVWLSPSYCHRRRSKSRMQAAFDDRGIPNDNIPREDDDDDEEEEEEEPTLDSYEQIAQSEFLDSSSAPGGSLIRSSGGTPTTNLDWGGALGRLKTRMQDVEEGKSSQPSYALFRYLSGSSPNTVIQNFVSTAKPVIVQTMSSTVHSLLGGLSPTNNPTLGIELIVKATGDKIANLCFQLQMTGCK